jgi:hypothetical protein
MRNEKVLSTAFPQSYFTLCKVGGKNIFFVRNSAIYKLLVKVEKKVKKMVLI